MLELVEDGLDKGKDVVECPVKHQSGRRVIQKHEEEKRHCVELELGFERAALGEDHAGDEVHAGHDDGQQIDRQTEDVQQAVRRAEVMDRAEGGALQKLQM